MADVCSSPRVQVNILDSEPDQVSGGATLQSSLPQVQAQPPSEVATHPQRDCPSPPPVRLLYRTHAMCHHSCSLVQSIHTSAVFPSFNLSVNPPPPSLSAEARTERVPHSRPPIRGSGAGHLPPLLFFTLHQTTTAKKKLQICERKNPFEPPPSLRRSPHTTRA